LVQGNFIGLGRNGNEDFGNLNSGILIFSSFGNQIGGTDPGAGNVIAGSGSSGINLTIATENLIAGNFVGTDATGLSIFAKTPDGTPNTDSDGAPHILGNDQDGISLNAGSSDNTIGGTTAAARNVISGNLKNGISVVNDSGGNFIGANYVGVDRGGNVAL